MVIYFHHKNEWIKVKRELQEAQELVQHLKQENEETRQKMLKQVEEKELELANALNTAAISEVFVVALKYFFVFLNSNIVL